MAVTGTGAFRRFVREFANAQDPNSPIGKALLQGAKAEVQTRIKDQFRRGVGPDDKPQPRRADGKPALVSRRLGNAARARVIGGQLAVEPKTPHVGDILDTQQDGHKFPPRHGKVYQYRDRRGRLISYSKFVRRVAGKGAAQNDFQRNGSFLRRYETTTKSGKRKILGSRGHSSARFGARVLPPRHIRPVGVLTVPWKAAIAKGFESAMQKRIGKYSK